MWLTSRHSGRGAGGRGRFQFPVSGCFVLSFTFTRQADRIETEGSCPCNQVRPCFLKDNNQSAKGAGGVNVASKIGRTFGLVDFPRASAVHENVALPFSRGRHRTAWLFLHSVQELT